jgi:hypothetical protein
VTRPYASDLVLARHRVRVSADDASLLREAVSVLVPLCAEEPIAVDEPAWEVRISRTAGKDMTHPEGHHVLAWPHSGMRLLDSAQFHAATVRDADLIPAACLSALIQQVSVAHLSDTGSGLAGYRLAARPARAVRAAAGAGQPVEVAFEWTGADRSPGGCLARYQAARTWWQHAGTGSP